MGAGQAGRLRTERCLARARKGVIFIPMAFEFDAAKSRANLTKHGIDFHTAQNLWSDPDALEVPARSGTEPRKLIIARHADKLWTAIFTEREGNVRVISVRRARTNEEALYEHADEDDGGES